MKYDILVQIFTSVHPILSVYIFTGSKTIFAKKKSDFFSPKILEIFVLSKFVLGYYKTKKKKKKNGGGGGKIKGGGGEKEKKKRQSSRHFFFQQK